MPIVIKPRLPWFFWLMCALVSVACKSETTGSAVVVGIGDSPYLPPVYTEAQCQDLLATFPGWGQVEKVPANDSQGRPTLWNAVIPITSPDQLDDLRSVGIDVESMPIFTDAADSGWSGQVGVVSKSTCGGAELHWALVPGPTFNAVKDVTAQLGRTLVDAIVILPVPDDLADVSVSYHGMHPASYQALHDAGFAYMGVSAPAPSPDEGAAGVTVQRSALLESIYKPFVRGVAALVDGVPNVVERGIGWIDRQIQGSVKLTIRLDLRNTDPSFGGDIGGHPGSPSDQSTPMVRAWGGQSGNQIQLTGVAVAAQQITLSVGGHGIRTRFQGDTDANSTVALDVTQGKSTGLCLEIENAAASVNDFLTRMEICDFEQNIHRNDQQTGNSFDRDTSLSLRLQNPYVNVLAQLTDGRDFLVQMAGYPPHRVQALTGPPTALLAPLMSSGGQNGAAGMTPCLDFPNAGVDLISSTLSVALGPAGWAVAQTMNAVYGVDMWLPDRGPGFETKTSLKDRFLATHEYGHYAMCSMLYDEDPTAMVQVPSLLLQRVLDGTGVYIPGAESLTVMEAWADFFSGQLTSGYSYFSLDSDKGPQNAFCEAAAGACWDGNYVEDRVPADPIMGVRNTVRRVATMLFDSFDGHPEGGFEPNQAAFWTGTSASPHYVRAAQRQDDLHDEPVALPATAFRTLMREWVKGASPVDWRVDEAQFLSALAAAIRGTPRSAATPSQHYSWCDACQVFAQHEDIACAFAGLSAAGGECHAPDGTSSPGFTLSPQQAATVCLQDPVDGIVGEPPAPTDPTSACTFTGCPAHTVLVGQLGDAAARCVACGTHQVAAGATCVECATEEFVGGSDGNTCVACGGATPHRLGNTCVATCDCGSSTRACYIDRSGTCVPSSCAAGQIDNGGSCLTCPPGTISVDGSECQVCLASQGMYQAGNQCLSCPAGQVPNSSDAATGCVACGPRQIAVSGVCQDCPLDQVIVAGQCMPCPAGEIRLGTVCIPRDQCQSRYACRFIDPSGLFCTDDIC